MKLWSRSSPTPPASPKYPGLRRALDGSTAVVQMETAASDAAGAYPITPSTQMGEGWAAAVADGTLNVNGRRLLFFEPEGEHAAAAVTTGMSMMGLRAANFSSGQGIAYMHESLYAAVGKRLTYVLNVAARAMTKHALNVHAGHDDYHAVDDTGFFQLFAKDVQGAADLNLIAHRIAELSLNPGICAQDGFLTSHVIESLDLPERELIKAYLGDPADLIEAPTPAQRLVFGDKRRRIPELFDLDAPAMLGVVQNQDSYAQGVAAQRPFYFDHVAELTDQAFEEFFALTGRRYTRARGYRLDDAEYVIVGQGSVVSNAEAVADHLRETRKLRVGVLDVTMFRPFPADLIARALAGRRGVVVMERVDQPLAVDPPLLREIRAAMTKALENGRAENGSLPYPTLPQLKAEDLPPFYSGCFGLGSRDLQPGHIAAAVTNMLPGKTQRRQFYLGVDFLRPGTRMPKLDLWQQQLRDAYPRVGDLSLPSEGDLNLLPRDAVSVRIHSVGGWGAITMGKNLAGTVFELFDLDVKANPKYGSEKKGQPTTFYASFAPERIRLNCELRHIDVALSPDPNVFRHSNPLAGLANEGAFVLQSERGTREAWDALPAWAQREIKERKLRFYLLDGFAIAGDEASDAELRYRMQGAAFMGAFFAVSRLAEKRGLDDKKLLAGIQKQLAKKFAKLGERVVADNLRVIERGYRELRAVDAASFPIRDDEALDIPTIPDVLDVERAMPGIANRGRFWEQVCFLNKTGSDGLADPFAAFSAIPAVTGAARDMTGVRLEVPEFIASKCTGCSQCWTQCPDSAIPGLVTEVDQLIEIGIRLATNGHPLERMKQVSKHLAKEVRRVLKTEPFTGFDATLDLAYAGVAGKLGWDAEKRAALDADYARLREAIADFPVARTGAFFDGPEAKVAGTGGLLSITINPEACKGCNLCVAVCPDGALVTVKQDQPAVDNLRKNWKVWQTLPDTPERFINVRDIDEGVGVLSSLLLRKDAYRSMIGGDGACMGCGEKTAVHLIISTIHALMRPRVEKLVHRLDELIAGLDEQARRLLSSSADLAAATKAGPVSVSIDDKQRASITLLNRTLDGLKDLRWRYTEGPGGTGRAMMGMANSTGCSSVWGSTYPYNPYPFPWANHLFQDSPSLAIGLFEGHMRKMADSFVLVRRAEKLFAGSYDASDEAQLGNLDWKGFTDEEFDLCPPIVSMGGDGAMLDIGFQNLSRLLASGKPIRVIVLDTQVYSNTGGQACTSGFTGQVSDMATYGAAQHGKTEVRKELALVAMAHRGAYVLQSSQASASHLVAGVLRGLQKRRPAVFNIYTPCPVEHGLADDWAQRAARFALESRAFPLLTFDPDSGPLFADALSLDGNPSIESKWPEYTVEYLDEDGGLKKLTLPLTIADWAATEGRFRKHFKKIEPSKYNEDLVPFHEYLELSPEDREGKTAYILLVGTDKRLSRLAASGEIVSLAEERQQLWSQLRELAGLAPSATVRDRIAADLESQYEARLAEMRAMYEAKLAELPRTVARRMADTLLRGGAGRSVVSALSATPVAPSMPGPERVAPPAAPVAAAPAKGPAIGPTASPAVAAAPASAPAATAVLEEDGLSIDPYIDSARCTSCNECTNLNGKLFAYNTLKQAEVKDPAAGTFAQLVTAAERCPVGAIHPGTPRNPKEKDLAKWLKRAEPFS